MFRKVFCITVCIAICLLSSVGFAVEPEILDPKAIAYGEYNSALGPGIGLRAGADKFGVEMLYYFSSKSKSETTEKDTDSSDSVIDFQKYAWELQSTGTFGLNLFYVFHKTPDFGVFAGGGLLLASGTTKVTGTYEEPLDDKSDEKDGEFSITPLHGFIGANGGKDNFVFDARVGVISNSAVNIEVEEKPYDMNTGKAVGSSKKTSHSFNLFDSFYISGSVGYRF